jgi:CBS domain-containing protein
MTDTPLTLRARTAADLMAPGPLSIRSDATVQEAIVFFTEKGIAAAPVIDDAGRPIGVLSRSDLLVHERESMQGPHRAADYFASPGLAAAAVATTVDRSTVADLMTPAVFAVPPDATARRVVEEMVALNVHRLFVVDPDGVLVGVVSAMDIVRKLT